MSKASRNYGVARDCAVCGARIPGTPVLEIETPMGTFPSCEHCEHVDENGGYKFNEEMIRRRIASGAYKVPKKSHD